MSLLKDLHSIAESLERLVQLGESFMQQQKMRLPQRAPTDEEPEPFAVSVYDPAREVRLEARAAELLKEGVVVSFYDAYERALQEERER